MKEKVRDQIQMRLRRAAVAVFAIGAVAVGTVCASPSSTVVAAPRTDLPALAPQSGEAMFLHETIDGRVFHYLEQNQGARLATFDVTDPVHIKGEGSVHLDASGSFNFDSLLGNQAELVRFRQGQQDTALDLPRVGAPKLSTVQGLVLPGPIADAENNALTVTSPTMNAPPALDFGAIDTVLSYELTRMFDVKQVRAQMMRSDAGTTFMLGENGLYIIRRPAVEWIPHSSQANRTP
jgi:hypothetical protein